MDNNIISPQPMLIIPLTQQNPTMGQYTQDNTPQRLNLQEQYQSVECESLVADFSAVQLKCFNSFANQGKDLVAK